MTTFTTDGWTPAVKLNLEIASASAFQEAVAEFRKWQKSQPALGPLGLQNGWYDVTPEMSENLLRRHGANRKISFTTVKKYYASMKNDDWQATGQPIIVNREGKNEDGAHREWASYFGGMVFHSYLITDAPNNPRAFAYIDDCKPRSGADALYTSGMNGNSSIVAQAIKLAWRYDNRALGIIKQPNAREMTTREILDYGQNHPGIVEAAHLVASSYQRAAEVIGKKAKPVTVFFAWKAAECHGSARLDEFLMPLGTGANLAEDSPILALRNRLLLRETDDGTRVDELRHPHRLALVILAFNLHIDGTKMERDKTKSGKLLGVKPLTLTDMQAYPRLEPEEDFAQAA